MLPLFKHYVLMQEEREERMNIRYCVMPDEKNARRFLKEISLVCEAWMREL